MYSRLKAHEIVCCAFILSVSLYFPPQSDVFLSTTWFTRRHIAQWLQVSRRLSLLVEIYWKIHSLESVEREQNISYEWKSSRQPHHITDRRANKQQKKCVQFPSDWVPRVEMMKKFNLMFNSNSHPFFIFAFPVTVPKMVIRFSIYMITNISECDFYGVWGAFRRGEKKKKRKGWDLSWIEWDFVILFATEKKKKRKFVTMKNLSIRDNCNPINSFPELLLYMAHEMG